MNILFVMKHRGNAGNTHAVANYMRVAQKHGHTIAMYGAPQPHLPELRFSTDVRRLRPGRLSVRVRAVPPQAAAGGGHARRRPEAAPADLRHGRHVQSADRGRRLRPQPRSEAERAEVDRVLRRAGGPRRQADVGAAGQPARDALPFYGYDPALEIDPALAPAKQYDILHVGHNWWRWREVGGQLLPAFEQIRDQVGEIGFIGLWWDTASRRGRRSRSGGGVPVGPGSIPHGCGSAPRRR